jgi:subtilisin family serine protease
MSDPRPYQGEVTSVNVAEQIVIGFKHELGMLDPLDIRQRMADVLKGLQTFGATVLQDFVAPSEKKAVFAIAIIRLEGRTFAELQEELKKPAYADVGWVERNAPIDMASYNDPLLPQQWALAKLGARDLWRVAPRAGTKTIVGIVDSGLRRQDGSVHADLGLVEPVAVCQPPGFFPNCIDSDGHGTLLAGTIAAAPDNFLGVASPSPLSWNISLLPVQFFDPGVPPNAANAAIAIAWAASNFLHPQHRARVINASWHVAPGDAGLTTLKMAILFATIFFDCLVVFAAGNDGTDNEFYPTYPANFANDPLLASNTLSVLATDLHDGKAFFSNYGKNTVAIGAPGMRILSTARYLLSQPRFAEYTGTSAAAAHVSAGAALVFALNPGWGSKDVIQHLIASADTIADLEIACIGGKRLNLGCAVNGPLHITAPLAGATLNLTGSPNIITWTCDYTNPRLTDVRIDFSTDNFVTTTPLTPLVPIGAGTFACPPGSLAATTTGQIRITPNQGNFPVVSDPFTVI